MLVLDEMVVYYLIEKVFLSVVLIFIIVAVCIVCHEFIKEVAGCSCEKGGVKKKVFGCLRGKGEKVG